VSSLYRTEPQIVRDQARFFNAALRCTIAETKPHALLSFLQGIEARNGRDRLSERPKGPRTLDLDIILFGRCRMASDELRIPHPAYRQRRFVLVPLLEIDPDLIDPVSGRRLSEYDEALRNDPSQGIYLCESDNYNVVTSRLRI
jgi:2-amino-4-hydroxy-6-hydroxymethyldihydropteridine diphosphokinase